MFANRVSEFFPQPAFAPAVAGLAPAFVSCCLPALGVVSQAQQMFVAEIYRRAQEMTEAQLRKPATIRRIPEFSLN